MSIKGIAGIYIIVTRALAAAGLSRANPVQRARRPGQRADLAGDGYARAGGRVERRAADWWAVTFPDGLTGFYATEARARRAAERGTPRPRAADPINDAIDRSPTGR
jgi:hypothetical protein